MTDESETAEQTHEPQGAQWLQQMLPRFAIITRVPTDGKATGMATHYGVGLPSGQVVLFTLGIGTIAILPDWEMIHMLIQQGRGQMLLVMEEKEVMLDAKVVA